jgi:Pentapeptide repeats (8 copies)/NACHT domain
MAIEKQRIRIWRFLTTDVGELNLAPLAELTKTGAEAAKAVLDLAKAIGEKKSDLGSLKPYIEEVSSLLDILNHPIAQVAKEAIPFAPIAVTLLKLICDVAKREPTLEQAVALVSQAAYLESLRSFLNEHPEIRDRLTNATASDVAARRIARLGDLELGDGEARRSILFFHESALASAFGSVLQQRLEESGLAVEEAQNVCDRVARGTDTWVERALAESTNGVRQLVQWYRDGGRESLEKYLSIEDYLRDYISPESTVPQLQQRWRVFNEAFLLPDLYVPLKAKPVDSNGEYVWDTESVDLTQWAWDLLMDEQQKDKVLFIQGGPGRGKSAFCRMFAEELRREQHPSWTPILIRLRDVRVLEKDFEETLRKAVDRDFAKSDGGWLNDRNTRFVFLLDGFDELLMEGRSSGGLEEFLKQVGDFQRSCATNGEKQHRVIVTGRSMSLQQIERHMPSNLERVEIAAMDKQIQSQWFGKWAKLVGTDKALGFQAFLEDPRCPERVRGSEEDEGLAQEPLLLYLLGAMHRDDELKIEQLEGQQGIQAKIVIYERTLDWVLTRQRPDDLNQKITEFQTEDLRRILAEAGLCVVQSGGECASLKVIEQRLANDDGVKQLLAVSQKRLQDNPLRNALAAFYLQAGKNGEGSVEFIHKSFGEFLCAERIKEAIEDWSKLGERRRDSFLVADNQFHWEIYDLLGYGGLSQEIMEYLTAMLIASNEIDEAGWIRLFERLNRFYEQWCEGRFIDELDDNPPQKKLKLLKEQVLEVERIGLRQVDIFAGLNVLNLLMILHRYAQDQENLKDKIIFYPSGKVPENLTRYTDQLLKVIHYADCLGIGTFYSIVGFNLYGVNLHSAQLYMANLFGANLFGANLFGANLVDANLEGVNLISANLEGASFYQANLEGANLRDANLNGADLSMIRWSNGTIWQGVTGLETAMVPDALKQQLGLA